MAALAPGNVIHKVVYRHLEITATCDRIAGKIASAVVVQPAEKDESLGRVVACVGKTLPNEAPSEVIDERRLQYRSIAEGEPFAQIQRCLLRAVPNEVRHIIMCVVSQTSAPKKRVVAVLCELVISPRNVPVVRGRDGGAKAEAREVHSVADRRVIGQRKTSQIRDHHGTRPDTQRIDCLDLPWRQSSKGRGSIGGRYGVGLPAQAGD